MAEPHLLACSARRSLVLAPLVLAEPPVPAPAGAPAGADAGAPAGLSGPADPADPSDPSVGRAGYFTEVYFKFKNVFHK